MFRFRALAAGATRAGGGHGPLYTHGRGGTARAVQQRTRRSPTRAATAIIAPTDVLSAWWSEANGRLQAVIKVSAATPAAAARRGRQIPGAGYAFVYSVGPTPRYVRAIIPISGPTTFDYGTYTRRRRVHQRGADHRCRRVRTGDGRDRDDRRAGGCVRHPPDRPPRDHVAMASTAARSHGSITRRALRSRPIRRAARTTSSARVRRRVRERRRRPVAAARRSRRSGRDLRPARRAQAHHGAQNGDRHRQGVARPRGLADHAQADGEADGHEHRHHHGRRLVQAACRGRGDHAPAGYRRRNRLGRGDDHRSLEGEDQGAQPGGWLGHRHRHRRSQAPGADPVAPHRRVKASAKTTAQGGSFTLRLKHPRPGRYQAIFIPYRRTRRAVYLEHRSHPMKPFHTVAVGVAVAALALPAAALAHPGVYTSQQAPRTRPPPRTTTPAASRMPSATTPASKIVSARLTRSVTTAMPWRSPRVPRRPRRRR